jgi:hypothetical protein
MGDLVEGGLKSRLSNTILCSAILQWVEVVCIQRTLERWANRFYRENCILGKNFVTLVSSALLSYRSKHIAQPDPR